MRIVLASDHVGRDLKLAIASVISGDDHDLLDIGTEAEEWVAYPEYAYRAASAVAAGDADRAILVCGGGVGMAIAANKVAGVRAVAASEPYSAVLSREHQDTNVLALGATAVAPEMAGMIVTQWLDAAYDGGIFDKSLAMIRDMEQSDWPVAGSLGG